LGRETATEFGEEISPEETELGLASKNYEYMAKKMLQAFGGKNNILDAYSCNTRLRVEVADSSLVEEQRIKQLGVSGIIKPTEKNYQVIIGLEVTYVMAEFDKLLEQ
jgi:PTS system N-acetylglucosamine-specific IIC component